MKWVWSLIFNALILLSLFLFVATTVETVLSYVRTHRYCWYREGHAHFASDEVFRVVVERGRIAFVYDPYVEVLWYWDWTFGFGTSPTPVLPVRPSAPIDQPFGSWGRVDSAVVNRFAGFERGHYILIEPYNSLQVFEEVWAIPLPFLAAVLAVLPALSLLASLWQRRRHRADLCPVCGYDLRATPNCCPE